MKGREVTELKVVGGRALALLLLLSVPCFLTPVPSLAFNSEEWLGKRELFAREAERLRAAYTNCVARLETPAEDVTIPVETFEDGSVKVMIFAKKAQYFLDKGLVWAEGPAKVTHGKTTFRGRGIYFSSPEGYVKVLEETDVDSQDLKFGGAL